MNVNVWDVTDPIQAADPLAAAGAGRPRSTDPDTSRWSDLRLTLDAIMKSGRRHAEADGVSSRTS